jgi:KDO2-lipid IV(A) lauroyltransferase
VAPDAPSGPDFTHGPHIALASRMHTAPANRHAERVFREIDAELRTRDDDDPRTAAFANAWHIADANLRHFFPAMTPVRTAAIIREILFHQRMTALDQDDIGLIAETRIEDPGEALAACADRAPIFCTYHLGSYKHLFHALAHRGIDCLLFVSGRTLLRQGEDFLASSERARASAGWRGRLDILDAEDRNSLRQGLRALRRGLPLVLYIDGNTGAGEHSANRVPVSFFGRSLRVRAGVAHLSHLSGAPIVPVACPREEDGRLRLIFHDAIAPAGERDAYAREATQRIFDRLAAHLDDDASGRAIGQWEGWLYAHRFLDGAALDGIDGGTRLSAERLRECLRQPDRYALLRYPGLRVLLDKDRFACTLAED